MRLPRVVPPFNSPSAHSLSHQWLGLCSRPMVQTQEERFRSEPGLQMGSPNCTLSSKATLYWLRTHRHHGVCLLQVPLTWLDPHHTGPALTHQFLIPAANITSRMMFPPSRESVFMFGSKDGTGVKSGWSRFTSEWTGKNKQCVTDLKG